MTGFLENTTSQQNTPILEALAAYIQQKTTLKTSIDDWLEPTPAHLLMNFSVVDDAGRELGAGRDWKALQKQLGQAAQLTFRNTSPDNIKNLEKTGLKQWDFGDLPQTLSFERDGLKVTGYPALEDNIDSVAVKLFDTEREAELNHRQGVCRLMRFELQAQIKQLEKNLPNFNQIALQLRNICNADELREDIVSAIADRAFIGEDALPRTNADFMVLKTRARTRLPAVSSGLGRIVQLVAAEYTALNPILNGFQMPKIKQNIEQQMQQLLEKQWVNKTPWTQLQHLPRYIKAKQLRLQKYMGSIDRDARNNQIVQAIWTRWQDKMTNLHEASREIPQALADYRWLIEELRVSLFAQELKTPFPVSAKRLDKIWADSNF